MSVEQEENVAKTATDSAEPKEKTATKKELEAELKALRDEQKKRDEELAKERAEREALKKELQDQIKKGLEDKVSIPKPVVQEITPENDPVAFAKKLKADQDSELAALRKSMEEQKAELEKARKELQEQLRLEKLALHKEKLLAKTDLKELIVGNSVEELDAALAKAVEIEKRLSDKIRKEVTDDVKKNLPRPTNPSNAGAAPITTKTGNQFRQEVAKDKDKRQLDHQARIKEWRDKHGY
jgi:hypothetical protein